MKTFTFLSLYWHFNLVAAILVVILVWFHIVTNGIKLTLKSFPFFTGILILILSAFSPLDYLGKSYLFSAHMTQHIIQLLIVPPLLLKGTDKEFLERTFSSGTINKTGNIIFHPLIAWIAGVGAMWVFHAPFILTTISKSPLLTDIQMILLVILGLIFIWPVFSPVQFRRLEPLQSAAYLFLACVGCTVLGILITFSPQGFFMKDMTIPDESLFSLITVQWGITPTIDQQIGGLIMWVPACIIYLSYVLITLFKWLVLQSPGKTIDEV